MIVPQGALNINYVLPKKLKSLTKYAGALPFLDLIYKSGLLKSIEKNLKVRTDTQGWSDAQFIITILLLNLIGGKCVDDVELLENDDGLCHLMFEIEKREFKNSAKTLNYGRWRTEKTRIFPSPTAIFDFLKYFHNESENHDREAGFAYIPELHPQLKGLQNVLKELLDFEQKSNPIEIATLDQDATLDSTNKESAFFCYKGYKAYQPMNTYWFEKRLLVHSEFRDGNVNAGFDELRVFKEALEQLPSGVKEVRLRTDTAGYQHDLLQYCNEGKNERFGKITFSICCNVTVEFKNAVSKLNDRDWHTYCYVDHEGNTIVTDHEVADVNYAPNWISHKKSNPIYRFIAIREPLNEHDNNKSDNNLPFQTIEKNSKRYKLFGLVTNIFESSAAEVVRWNRERCGKSEEVHKYQKIDLACQNLPSKYFGSNAAWWQIMVLAFNLITIMKKCIGFDYRECHLKYLRDNLINIPGYIINHAHKNIIRLGTAHAEVINLLLFLRRMILKLGAGPPVLMH